MTVPNTDDCMTTVKVQIFRLVSGVNVAATALYGFEVEEGIYVE
jgi:hypothetical protein